jgi:hypothetical protein
MKYTLDQLDYAALVCLESGHWWEDAPLLVTKAKDGTTVWQRRQKCKRYGCPRFRTRNYEQHTMRPIGQYQYEGDKKSLEQRAYKEDLMLELLARTQRSASRAHHS